VTSELGIIQDQDTDPSENLENPDSNSNPNPENNPKPNPKKNPNPGNYLALKL